MWVPVIGDILFCEQKLETKNGLFCGSHDVTPLYYRWVNRLTIESQTFCGLKEIELKTRKIQRKSQQCVTIMQSRLANKKRLLATPTR